MSETKKHRVFWIEDRHETDKPICRPYKKYVSTTPFGGMVGDEDYPNCEMIRAVDLSALIEEKQKAANLIVGLQLLYAGVPKDAQNFIDQLIKKYGDV